MANGSMPIVQTSPPHPSSCLTPSLLLSPCATEPRHFTGNDSGLAATQANTVVSDTAHLGKLYYLLIDLANRGWLVTFSSHFMSCVNQCIIQKRMGQMIWKHIRYDIKFS